MARKAVTALAQAAGWTCRQCTLRSRTSPSQNRFVAQSFMRPLTTTGSRRQELVFNSGIEKTGFDVVAAPEINENTTMGDPARLIPASASYFTTSPLFNDHILRLTHLVESYGSLPTIPSDQAPRILFMTLTQFRSSIAEKVGAAKYAKLLVQLRRLNLIHPNLRPASVQAVLEEFRRPGSGDTYAAKPKTIDHFGRAKGVGRRKSAVARVQLVEGSGEVMINGMSISKAFPRLHDRESVVWPLKITNRLDKYNVFVVSHGGGSTGQAESVTLGLANALMVHEPALKPVLRKAGCVTRVMKRVERKKTGRVKARKRPTWVKR